MATKNILIGAADTSFQRHRAGTGGDGKVELPEFGGRLRWNDYNLIDIICKRSAGSSPNFTGDYYYNGLILKSVWTSNDELRLQNDLLKQVRGHDFNLGTSLAEGKQTVNMVTNAATAIGGAILDLKKGRFESAARRFGVAPRPSPLNKKDVAGRWLELQYGWLPLLSDVYEASKAFEVLTSGPRITRIYAHASAQGIIDVSESPSLFSCKGVQRASGQIIYEASEEMSAARSLGLTNPLSVAWELIPYSFVADWFIPIGTYLENLNQIPTLRGRFLMTVIEKSICTSQPRPFSETGITWFTPPKLTQSTFTLTRQSLGTLSVPTPTFVSLDDAMSPKRIWNSLALLVQKL